MFTLVFAELGLCVGSLEPHAAGPGLNDCFHRWTKRRAQGQVAHDWKSFRWFSVNTTGRVRHGNFRRSHEPKNLKKMLCNALTLCCILVARTLCFTVLSIDHSFWEEYLRHAKMELKLKCYLLPVIGLLRTFVGWGLSQKVLSLENLASWITTSSEHFTQIYTPEI